MAKMPKLAKKFPLRPEWSEDEMKSLIQELNEEADSGSERSAILVGGAALDECLSRMIFEAMPERIAAEKLLSSDERGPLGTFAARILAARALGLITVEEQGCIETVRKIRNTYAHNFGHAINRENVVNLVRELNSKVDRLGGDEEYDADPGRELKIVFISCVLGLLILLLQKSQPSDDET